MAVVSSIVRPTTRPISTAIGATALAANAVTFNHQAVTFQGQTVVLSGA